MKGAIVGDILGSPHEHLPEKEADFNLLNRFIKFTDDTILTVAVANALLTDKNFENSYVDFSQRYPNRGYGRIYKKWVYDESRAPYNSFGNGSAMRVSPVAWYFNNLEDVLEFAKKTSEVTHDHEDGIKGAQAVASAIFLARNGNSKEEIKKYIENNFSYNLSKSYEEMYNSTTFDMTCPGSVPDAINCFLLSENFEDGIRKVINLGGDSDTQAAICGSIMEAYYGGVPDYLWEPCKLKLSEEFLDIIERFEEAKSKI